MLRFYLRLIQAWDRFRLRRLQSRYPGLEIDPSASTNLASARFNLAPDARLKIGPRVVTERNAQSLRFSIRSGASVAIGADTWLRTELEPIQLIAFAGGAIEIGSQCWLNGAQISAKRHIEIGDGTLVGTGCRMYDADQHPVDAEHDEEIGSIHVGEDVWISSDVTLLRGAEVGSHCVIGTRSLVADRIPDHTKAYGSPAKAVGQVGDRKSIRMT